MGFNFPNAPTDGTTFAPAGGPSYVFSNGVWKLAGGGTAFVVVSDTPPPTPFPGQLWWESDTGALFFWYVDANSSQWVQINFTPSNSGISSAVQTLLLSSGTYTKPANLKFLDVEAQGPGGAGAGANATGATAYSASGGAGAGAWGRRLFAASELPASVPYTIGAPGLGVNNATVGASGSTTSFGTTFNCDVGGGVGSSRTGTVTTHTQAAGGAGGTAGSGWTISRNGATGWLGWANFLGSTFNMRPRGADSMYGHGLGDFYTGNAAGLPGGGSYGSGGGGSVTFNGAAQTGGDGKPSFILLTEYF